VALMAYAMTHLAPSRPGMAHRDIYRAAGPVSVFANFGHYARRFGSDVPPAVVSKCSKLVRYSITSSAVASSDGGRTMPSILAV
jgi:hypothetical protein